jgi:hypothetical protein
MPNPPSGQFPVQPKMTYVDRPEISETFADSLGRMNFDGLNAKLEFVVNRMDNTNPPALPTGKAITACRLVLPVVCILDLHAKLSRLIATLEAQGALKKNPQVPQSGKQN